MKSEGEKALETHQTYKSKEKFCQVLHKKRNDRFKAHTNERPKVRYTYQSLTVTSSRTPHKSIETSEGLKESVVTRAQRVHDPKPQRSTTTMIDATFPKRDDRTRPCAHMASAGAELLALSNARTT